MKRFHHPSFQKLFIVTVGAFLLFPLASQAATLTLSPTSGSYMVGQSITITILLNTQGVGVDGVDVKSLNYNPALLSIQDDDPNTAGVQIATGTLLPVSTGNLVQSGKITFSQVSSGASTSFTNNTPQTLATIHATVLATGNAILTFDFTLNNTTDSNVSSASTRADVLSSVGNGSYTLQTDTTPPSAPTSLSATAVSSSQINLAWSAATDNIGVTGYRISRNGTQVGTTLFTGLSFSDTGLSAATTYIYSVVAVDQASNVSVPATVNGTTQAGPNTLPKGALDGATPTNIAGWAYDADAGSAPITVHIYIDGALAQAVTANLPRPDLVAAGATPDPNHGFSWTGFSLTPGTHTVDAYAINVPTGTNPKLGTLSLVISNPAPTATLTASPNTITSGQSSTLTWSSTNATSCTASGGWSGAKTTSGSQAVSPTVATTYAISCTGAGGTASQNATVTVNQPTFNFSLANTPSGSSVTQGGSWTNIITATLLAGSSQSVSFSVSGLPTGVTSSFSQPSCAPTCSSTLTLATTPTTPTGTSTITVTASGGGVSKTTSFSFTVAPPGFNFSLANDGNKTVTQGATATATIAATLLTGTPQPVTLSASGLPSGASASFTITSCNPSCSSVLTLSTNTTTPVGTSTITVTASGGGVSTTSSLSLTVNALPAPTVTISSLPTSITSGQSSTLTWSSTNATSCTASGGWSGAKATSGSQIVSPTTTTSYSLSCSGATPSPTQTATVTVTQPAFDFTIVNGGDVSVVEGASITNTLNTTLANGTASQPVNFSVTSGLPSGVTASFSQSTCSPSCANTITLASQASTPLGSVLVTVSAIGGGVTKTTSFNFIVIQPPPSFDFALTNGGSQSVLQGASINQTVSATLVSGTSQAVSFAVSGLPSGVTANFAQPTCTPTCSDTLVLSAGASAALGGATITITAIGGAVTKTSTFSFTVIAPPPPFNFTLSNGGNKSLIQGASVQSSITVNLSSGSTQPVMLSLSGLPNGASASFSPTSCNPNCTSQLTISTTNTTPTGSSTITVTGTGGTLTQSTSFSLTVSSPPPPPFDFSLSNAGGQIVAQAASITNMISTTLLSGAAQAVSFSVSGLPAGVNANFSASTCLPACSTTLTIATLDTTPSGSYTINVTAAGGGVTKTSSFNLVIQSLGSPVISNIQQAANGLSMAITWDTNRSASSQVRYGFHGTVLATFESDINPGVTNHSVVLANLIPCTTYYYQVRSADSLAREALGSEGKFTTSGCFASAPVIGGNDALISVASGGSAALLDSQNRGVGLSVPSGFAASNASFQLYKIGSAAVMNNAPLPAGLLLVADHTYELRSIVDSQAPALLTAFDKPISVSIDYSSADITGINPSSLRIYRYGGQWNPLTGCSIDSQLKAVTCATTGFSPFLLVGQAPDTTPPAAIANLAASNATQTSIDLSWLAPGDDGNQGIASSYELRYSTTPLTDQSFSQATFVPNVPAPLAAGSAQAYTLLGLSPSTTYYVAIKTKDEVPNISAISNVITATTLAAPVSAPQASVVVTAPNGGQCLEQGQKVTITWTRTSVDHTALYYTTDGGVSLPQFGSWFQMFSNGDTSTSYDWTIPSNLNSDNVRIWVEGHDQANSQRLAIDASDNNIQIKPSCSQASPASQGNSLPTPAPANTGGSGGQFSPSDTTPPGPVASGKAQITQGTVTLTWRNPGDADYVRTLIVRKQSSAPTSAADGTLIFQDAKETFTDSNLDSTQTYYYAIYAIDHVPNYSTPLIVSADMTQGSAQINPGPVSGPTITPSTPVPGIHEGDLLRGPDKIKVYIVNQAGYKRHIFNPQVFSFYGHFKWNAIRDVDQATLDMFANSDLYRAANDSRVYLLSETNTSKGLAQKHWLNISVSEFHAIGYSDQEVFVINTRERDYYQVGNTLNTKDLTIPPLRKVVAKAPASQAVYYINADGIKKLIPSAQIFVSYGNRWQDVLVISQGELNAYPAFQGFSLQKGDGKVYILEAGQKRWVKNAQAFARLGLDWSKVVAVNQAEFSFYPEGVPIE